MAKLDAKMEDILNSVSFMSKQFDDFNKKLESSLIEMKLLRNDNEKIKLENLRLSNEILEIKQKLDSFEQHNLGNRVEIKGVPKSPNENCIAIVQQIAKKLNITITTTEASRLSISNNSYPIIIAKLETAEMRKNLIRSSKTIKLNANMLSGNWSTDNKIFINERLTKDKRILFANTRSTAKEKNYKFVWITNSDILIRKDENSKIIRIKSEESSSGVILFSFGSTILMSSMPDRIKTDILEALAQLSQGTLMEYEGEMEDKPDNIMLGKWFPQRDILAHPNVKLFISHGGISGVYEAVDAGVPVVGFPLCVDQYRNIDNTWWKRTWRFPWTYKKNAEIASSIFKDRPMSPQQSVVYWTEYAIRHKGAPHLKSQALNLTWYQYFLLDVITTMSILIAVIFFVAYKVYTIIYKLFLKYPQKIKTKLE
ncbi:Baculovirus FP protein,UDP-glucuronosyl/UDP-glucosyltransferase [Cinara cedri]|uniref:UDP-glucuronosyltransferase n=1 Tax=Cinara cedri TaxID=506608 RepID=A0A5E4MQT9_9HEMI|nr:Baculovirus FP protein,UDP-glucuronosyl/UDP-glucosyltransferase [Cinara cedri]